MKRALGSFQTFPKIRGDIHKSWYGAPPVSNFAAGVNETGGASLRIFEKICNVPNRILRGLGDADS